MTADKGFQDRLRFAANIAQDSIESSLSDLEQDRIAAAMRYAVRGGKGLRAFLVIESAGLFGVSPQIAAPAAGAIEALHGYSLVHDDLPAMDDDDLRRGQPTVHKAWDEATAILAGDALQSLAFELLAGMQISDRAKLDLVSGLAHAAGVRGMVGGQAMDIAAETADKPLSLDEITRLQDGKTGALFVWSTMAGALMAGDMSGPEERRALTKFARAFGLAFQIADDVLDETGDELIAGKRLQKDAQAGKATFVSILGLEGAKDRAHDLVDEAVGALDIFGPRAGMLCAAAQFVLARDK